ncbi:MAG: MBL fold metallo-hydrolase [Candidatus Thermoplasmatota archaeon]|nr:MBL fold metallo-hydrolase [Candidatus Thermoplasmatota archaeon]
MSGGSEEARVLVLCEGYIVRDHTRIIDASSTVTLITSEGLRVVVDTGAYARIDELAAALAGADISPEEVDVVVNTHLHMDHCGGNEVFPNARRYAHRLEDAPIGTIDAKEGTEICEGVSVVETPGHTKGSISVLVRSDRNYVICGDALPTRSNYESMTPPAIHVDRRLAISSMERVIGLADVVVPGHDPPFETLRKM